MPTRDILPADASRFLNFSGPHSRMTLASPTSLAIESPKPSIRAGRATRPIAPRRGLVGLYMELTKARLSSLVLMTTAAGFVMAPSADNGINWALMGWTILGTALCAASANAFNQVIEVRRDARMRRTADRPLPAGHLRIPMSFA